MHNPANPTTTKQILVAYDGGFGYYPAKADNALDAIREFRLTHGYTWRIMYVCEVDKTAEV